MESAGVELERFSRFPTWRLVGFGLLALFLGDELLVAARTGELRLPPWLGDRGVVVVMAATVMGVVGLGFELARQAFAELLGQCTLAALTAKGLVVRRRFRERFVPWSAVKGLDERHADHHTVTLIGTPVRSGTFTFFAVALTDGTEVLVREAEGGQRTANVIAQHLLQADARSNA